MKKSLPLIFSKRLFDSIIVLLVVISVVFLVLKISPGDPSLKYLSPNLNPELLEKVKSQFAFNGTLPEQYFSFISSFITGNWGVSTSYQLDVFNLILIFLPFTIIFAFISFSLQLTISFSLAFITAVRKYKSLNTFISKILLIVYATPSFVTGLMLIFIFSVQWRVFPSGGLISLDHEQYDIFQKLFDFAKHLALPVATIVLSLIPIYYKYLRDNLDNLFDASFILNLRAQGVEERKILFKNIIPNALNPIIATAGIDLGLILGGTLITEVIFGLPGMGRLTMDAIGARDYSLIIGCCFTSAALMIFVNMMADLLRGIIDKRSIKEMIE